MQLFSVVFERLPVVWFLLGLLFISLGLYLGLEYSMAFAYVIVGLSSCAYGLAILLLRLWERPETSDSARLSPKFISAGATVIMPASMGKPAED